MRKLIIALLIVFCITGCSVEKINTNNYDYLIENVILKGKKVKNEVFDGFSLYIPRGMKIVDKDDYNIVLSDKYDNYYYIYVDVVSYYNKVKNTYKSDNSLYFSKKFTSFDNKKSGYLEIREVNNKYFVQAVYNYVKIEVYSSKESLNQSILYVSQILSSIKYNNKVIKMAINNSKLYYKEENFNIFTTKKTTTNYLDYIEKYDSDALDSSNVKNKKIDDDMIDTDIDEE